MHGHRILVAVFLLGMGCLSASMPASADQKIKTKSNIKNDRVAASCGETCHEAGEAWAAENKVSRASDCASSSPAFTEGCEAYVQAQQPAESATD